ncbi:hypothetical protein [Falsiruegeria mediterranea]|uniref:Oxidoreductase molybdopterin-binding domain-containing protein n=1 Tax=Falsiruegeria mediterranea M17 TaxID=1200281 RepID=A0A2R8CB73_9RHOB|nr:hypothetical protein [Falsiruegeria mediterranea]SPJ29618.1 hypothetical protein TRM7615_03138 [Falsiruegeria mediterranea M17]
MTFARTAALCVALLSPLHIVAEIAAPSGPVLVTLGGAVGESNLPARGVDDGGLFGFLEVAFDTAVGLDTAMLGSLPQHTISILYGPEDSQREYAFSGPSLADVMALAGASGKSALPMAMDGYQTEIPWDMIQRLNPILATHADGAPMGIGSYGPTMVVFPPTDNAEDAEAIPAKQVWAIAYIGIE